MLPLGSAVVEDASVDDHGAFLAREVTDELKCSTGIDWHVGVGSAWSGSVLLTVDAGLRHQQYRLVIRPVDGDDETAAIVTVSGGDVAGVRHGVQTLRQIIRQRGRLLPEMVVEDEPAYPVRGYSLDVTRGRVPTMAWLKRWVDLLELYKYNQLQLYVEHSFRFPGMSETYRGADALAPEDVAELDDYCQRRGIELVPSISTFGHQYMSMRTIGLRGLGELPEDADRPFSFIERQEHHTLNIADPRTFGYSTGLIDAFRPLVRSRRSNIGADETFDLGKGASGGLAERIGTPRMYADYVARLCSYVADHGGEPMLWGDIAVEMPQILGMLPHDVILLNWLYSPDVDATKVRLVAQAGARQYVCPAVQGWNALLPRVDDAWNNIMRLARYGLDYGAEGWLVTDWGDYGHVNDPRMSVAGMIYGACGGWLRETPRRSVVDAGISSLHYGDVSGRVMGLLAEASRQTAFGWDDLVRYLELDDGGSLNKDVLAVAIRDSGKAAVTSVEGARRAYMALLSSRLATAAACNRRLAEMQARLSSLLPPGGSSTDRAAFAVALEGQCLLNDVGVHLAADGSEGCEALARRLEEWWEVYIAQWRSVSHESELGRISRVVWACADILHRRALSSESAGDGRGGSR